MGQLVTLATLLGNYSGCKETFFNERLSSILKVKCKKEMTSSLKVLCSTPVGCHIEDGLAAFMAAFSVELNYEDIADLETRVDLMTEANDYMLSVMPTAKGGGTSTGGVLASWPRGKQIVDSAAEHLAKARLTLTGIKTFDEKLARVSQDLGAIKDDLAAASVDSVNSAVSSMNQLRDFVSDAFTDCLAEFTPTASTGKISAVTSEWVHMLSDGHKTILAKGFVSTMDEQMLAKWSEDSSAVRERLSLCLTCMDRCKNIFSQTQSFKLTIILSDFTTCLSSLLSFLEALSDPSVEECQLLQKRLNALVAWKGEQWLQEATGQFRESPLIKPGSAFRVKLQTILNKSGLENLEPYRKLMVSAFPGGSIINIGDATPEQLSSIETLTSHETDFNSVIKWSTSTADGLLLSQVRLEQTCEADRRTGSESTLRCISYGSHIFSAGSCLVSECEFSSIDQCF